MMHELIKELLDSTDELKVFIPNAKDKGYDLVAKGGAAKTELKPPLKVAIFRDRYSYFKSFLAHQSTLTTDESAERRFEVEVKYYTRSTLQQFIRDRQITINLPLLEVIGKSGRRGFSGTGF